VVDAPRGDRLAERASAGSAIGAAVPYTTLRWSASRLSPFGLVAVPRRGDYTQCDDRSCRMSGLRGQSNKACSSHDPARGLAAGIGRPCTGV
jgi:hypothetical protein